MKTGCLYKTCNECRIKEEYKTHLYDKEKAREQYLSYRNKNYESIRTREREYQKTHKELFKEKDVREACHKEVHKIIGCRYTDLANCKREGI